jgi:hypothetical protein
MEHSINRNKIYYELRLTKDGGIDAHNPIHAYWIMWEKDSAGKRREEMSMLEKKMAYGFKVGMDSSKKNITINLVSFPQRTITVFQTKEKPVARTAINGQPAILQKIFVQTSKGKVFPTVEYVELFGKNVAAGKPCQEKVPAPKK